VPDVALKVPRFASVEGFVSIAATIEGPDSLNINVVGNESCVHAINMAMMNGPVDAELSGTPIRMRHFNVLNQGDRRRAVVSARYDELGQSEPLGPTASNASAAHTANGYRDGDCRGKEGNHQAADIGPWEGTPKACPVL